MTDTRRQRHIRRRLSCGLAVLGLLTGAMQASAADGGGNRQPPEGDGPSGPPTARVSREEIVRFRTTFGFPTDGPGLPVQAGDYPTRNMDFGVPLTAAESADMHRRARFQNGLAGVDEVLAANPDAIGGSYMDQHKGGALVVQFAGSMRPDIAAAVRAKAPAEGRVEFAVVEHPLPTLKAAHRSVADAIESLKAEGVSVTGIGVDHKANRVAVSVLERTSGDAEAIGRVVPIGLVDIRVKPYDANHDSRADSPGQIKSGIVTTTNGCTTAFGARDGLGGWHVLSAAHCSGSPLYHNTTNIGPVGQRELQNNGNTDALRITTRKELVSNEVYVAVDNRIVITSVQPPAAPRDGDGTCFSGRMSGTRCGNIVPGGSSVTSPGAPVNGNITLHDQVWASFPSIGGDSGSGVWWHGGVALGILSRGNDTSTTYSKIGNVTTNLGVVIQTARNPVLLRNVYSGKCLDVQWNGTANGTSLWQWPCNNGPAQQMMIQFNFPNQFFMPGNGKCLDFDLNQNFNTGKMQLWQCLGAGQANQLFELERVGGSGTNFRLRNAWNGRCVDIRGPSTADGAIAQQYDCLTSNQTNQHWYLAPT